MRTLLIVTALVEAAAGIAIFASPSLIVSLLIGSHLDTLPGIVVGRLAGIALLTLGLVCWLARNQQEGRRVGAGPVAAMLFYNIAVAALLAYAGLGLGLSAIGLWPAVALHAILALWCLASLRTG